MEENNYEKQPKRRKRKIRKEMRETATSHFVSHFSDYFGRYFSWRKKFNMGFLISCVALCLAFLITFITFSSSLSKTNKRYNSVNNLNYDLNALITAGGIENTSQIYNDAFLKEHVSALIKDNANYEIRVNNSLLKTPNYDKNRNLTHYTYTNTFPSINNNPRSILTIEITERYSEKARYFFTTADLQKYSDFVEKDANGEIVKNEGIVQLKSYTDFLVLPQYLMQLVERDEQYGEGNVTIKTEANALGNYYVITFKNLHRITAINPSDDKFTCFFTFKTNSTSPNAVKVDYSKGLGGEHLMNPGRGEASNTITTVPNFFFKFMQNTTDENTISSYDTHPLYSGFTIQIEREYKDATT